MLDHANVSATAEVITGWFEMTADTRSLLVLPLFHVNGIMVSVVSPLLAGGSTFIAELVITGIAGGADVTAAGLRSRAGCLSCAARTD